MASIKDRLGDLIENNPTLKGDLSELKELKLRFRDLLNSEKLRTLMRKLAAFLVAVRDIYCKETGETEEQLIDAAAEYLDKKIELPIYLEPFDALAFKLVLRSLMDAIEKMAETQTMVAMMRGDLQITYA